MVHILYIRKRRESTLQHCSGSVSVFFGFPGFVSEFVIIYMDTDLNPSINKPKKSRKTFSLCFVTLMTFYLGRQMKMYQQATESIKQKSKLEKKPIFLWHL
jgi:hypothetical protein